MSVLDSISSIFREPPPVAVFELSETGVASALLGAKTERGFRPLKPGTVTVSPLKDNITDADDLAKAVRESAPPNPKSKRRDVAVIIPDYCTRISVLDFDDFPKDPKEQLSLVRFRMKKAVPYDVESAAVSYFAQLVGEKKYEVVVTVAPIE